MKGVTADLVRGKTDLDFGDALNALKGGHRVARTGWNGKGMWLGLVKGDDWKLVFQGNEEPAFLRGAPTRSDGRPLLGATLTPFIAMKTADDALVPWLASQSDLLADDWMVCV